MKGYYFITDQTLSRAGSPSDVKAAVAAKAAAVQYRRKDADTGEMYREALQLRKICRGVPFLINDRVDIALAVAADGVHLGQEDLPCAAARKILGRRKIIGVTVHSLAQAVKAEKDGADYVAVSPIFETATKPDAGRPIGRNSWFGHNAGKSGACPPAPARRIALKSIFY